MKRLVSVFLVLALALSLATCDLKSSGPEIRNVIVMITDGTSATVPTLSRWYKAYNKASNTFDTEASLAVDPLISGLVRTYWQSPDGEIGAITDSAPAATAYATGYKSNNQYVGVDSAGQPRSTVLELAKSQGKSTGLVSTVHTQHATPAAFAAHTTDRNDFCEIAIQMVDADIDVVLGGGEHYLLPQNRSDGRDLCAQLREQGYDYLRTSSELAAYNGNRVWGMFADKHMHYDMDRPLLGAAEPSLREMTQAAIDILSRNKQGFFLMVEGSKVDWGAHNNDPASIVSEFLAFDDAVDAAVTFAKGRKDTMVLILPDHGTGGLSIGSSLLNDDYSSTLLSNVIAPLSQAQITAAGAMELLMQGRDAREVLALYGITDPTDEELNIVASFDPDPEDVTDPCYAVLGAMLSRRCLIGWTTTGHVGEDVLLYSYLPHGKRLGGVLDNTGIAKIVESAFKGSLDELSASSFNN